jgi:DNA replication licensing factor MCM4
VRAILLEVMEQQTISIAKAGIICTLNARTSILASANPVGSRYDPKTSVMENLKLPPTLLSRFDLIYLILDRADQDQDRQLAKHLVRLFTKRSHDVEEVRNKPKYTLEEVSKFVTFARETCKPLMPEEVKEKLIEAYVEMRKLGNLGGGKKTIVATPRQLESFVRLAEAHAKLRLAKTLTLEDVDEAVRLFNVATQKAAMDPRTGQLDMDALVTGVSTVDRAKEEALLQFLKEFVAEQCKTGQVVAERALLETLNGRGEGVERIERAELTRVLESLQREQLVVLSKSGMRVL